jgi:hypothetical protein
MIVVSPVVLAAELKHLSGHIDKLALDRGGHS